MSRRANAYNTVKTCESLNSIRDLDVTLVSTDRALISNESKRLFFDNFAVKNPFNVVSLRSIGNFFRSRKFFMSSKLEILFANLGLVKFIYKHRRNYELVYCRDPFLFPVAFFAKRFLGKPLFFEIHAVLHRKISQKLSETLAKNSNGLIVISRGLKDYYQKLNKNILVSFCSAAEPERFTIIKQSKEEIRDELELPRDKILLGYTGNLYRTGNNDSYGIEDIISSLPYLSNQYLFVGVGKSGSNTLELESLANELSVSHKTLFIPWTSREIIAKYIRAFDILCIPSAGAQIGNWPTKIFDYLASGRPIVAARTQAITEILNHEYNSILVDYKKPQSWSRAFVKLSSDKKLVQRIVARAIEDSKKYTWQNRGLDIYNFIKENT